MQSITSAELELLEAYAPVHLHLYIGGTEVKTELGAFSLTSAVGESELTCGNAIAAIMDLSAEATDVVKALSTHDGKLISTHDGKVLAARMRWAGLTGMGITVTWDVDGETEHGLFHGIVERPTVSAGKVTLSAQDALFWGGSKPFPVSSYQSDTSAVTALQAIAAEMGVALSSGTASLASGVTISGGFSSCPDDLTCAEAAGYAAGILGGNAIINRDGELEVRLYSSAGFTTEPYAGGATAEGRNYKIPGICFQRTYQVTVHNDDGTTSESTRDAEYMAGDGSIEIDNPLADLDAATRAYNALKTVVCRKGTYEYPMGIQVEPGDVITVTSMDGSYPVAISSQMLTIDGGVRSSVQGAGQLYPDGNNGLSPTEEAASTAPATRALRTASLLRAAGDEESSETPETYTPGRKGPISRRLDILEAKVLRVLNLYAQNAEIVSAKIQNLFAEEILCTNSFEVNNSVWELLQDSTGFKLQTKAKSTVAPYNPIAKLSMDATGGDFIFGDFGSGLHYVVGSSLYGGGTLTLLNGATGITIEGDVITIGGGSKVAISSLSIGNAIIPDDFSTPSIGTSSSRFDYIYLSHNPNVSSDRNVKRNIQEDLPDIVEQLRPVRYKRQGGPETIHYGFVAQDVEEALEAAGVDTSDLGLVTFDTDQDGTRRNYALSYSEFIPLLVDKLQRQQKQIDELTRRIEALERSEKHG